MLWLIVYRQNINGAWVPIAGFSNSQSAFDYAERCNILEPDHYKTMVKMVTL